MVVLCRLRSKATRYCIICSLSYRISKAPASAQRQSILHLWRLADRLDHFLVLVSVLLHPPSQFSLIKKSSYLNHHDAHLLLALAEPNSHVLEQRRVSDVARVAIAGNVGSPFELGGVGVAGPDVARLELLKLLLGAEFVGLCEGLGLGLRKAGHKDTYHVATGIKCRECEGEVKMRWVVCAWRESKMEG